MASSSSNNGAMSRKLAVGLRNVGTRLVSPPSSTDKIIDLLLEAESIIIKIHEKPAKSITLALNRVMEALVKDEYLKHTNVNAQAVLGSCLVETIRITAPRKPYNDSQLKDIFQLFMVVLKKLHAKPCNNFDRAARILEVLAMKRSCLLMKDIGNDQMIVDMFKFLLATIRPYHSVKVFKMMEIIMTLMIKEGEGVEVSMELLRPLIESVKTDNENIASLKLGKNVLENCRTKLQCHIREAVNSLNLEVKDYAEIIASLCQEDTCNENMVAEETIAASTGAEQETDMVANRRRRIRKPNSLMRPEEGYEHPYRKSRASNNNKQRKNEDAFVPSELGKTIMPSDHLQGRSDSVDEGISDQRRQSKNKESKMGQHNDEELSSEFRKRATIGGTDSLSKDGLLLQEPGGRNEIIYQNRESRDSVDEMQSSQKEEADCPSPPKEPTKRTGKKIKRRKAGSSRK